MSDLPFIQTVISLASHAIELGDCAIIIWKWGVLNVMGREKVKLWCRVRAGGGARCQFFKHIGGLLVILIFKWYIIYSN